MKPLDIETLLAQAGSRWDERTGGVSMPIVMSTAFRHPEPGKSTGWDYARGGSPTRGELERTLALLDGGSQAFAFSTGMAAIDCALRLFAPGDRILVVEDLYGGTYRLLKKIYEPWGLRIEWVSVDELHQNPERFFQSGVKGFFAENPTNPVLKKIDLARLLPLAKKNKVFSIVDNTFLTPVLQRPLELGADLVVYSATKYLGGHNDLLAGSLVVKDPLVAERLVFLQKSIGAVLGSFDSWLLLRGLKTLAVRMRAQEVSARKIAAWLRTRKEVRTVYDPGLGAMLSFELDSKERLLKVLKEVKVWLFAESLGGVESLITFPAVQTHGDVEPEKRERQGITDRLLRLSVGLENAENLCEDLGQAFA